MTSAPDRESPDEFRTIVRPGRLTPGLNYRDSILCLGSCFAESMGAFLSERKFLVDINPFGVLYNPLSISRALDLLLGEGDFSREDLNERNGLWYSFDHHGSFSAPDPDQCLAGINTRLRKARETLRHTSRIIITLGTARVHEREGMVVANRHKLPEREFTERRTNIPEIVAVLSGVMERVLEMNADARFLFTVSPIRHWKDGPMENQYSKAMLICAVRELTERFERADYFPAYEIMLDDLRDYRFYDSDMLHPSRAALDYIWRRFRDACLDRDCLDAMTEIESLARAAAHRPLHPDAPDHLSFMARHLTMARAMAKKFPHLDFEPEIAHFSPPY